MHPRLSRAALWDTASSPEAAESLPMELDALGDHFVQCGAMRGPLQSLRSGAGRLQGLLAPRVATAGLLIAAFAGLWMLVA